VHFAPQPPQLLVSAGMHVSLHASRPAVHMHLLA